uniref:Putative LOC100899403 [Metaseiulus occidentalis] n=1 Tax=Lepeophtheirus salmonis TaxID=72036 RepID=A0A0K2TK52_LEPSM
MRQLSSFAFLPQNNVMDIFEELTEDETIPIKFIAYFELIYVGKLRGRRTNMQ